MFFPERIRSIQPADRVLEIGPGGAPHPRSDVLLDRTYGDPREEERQRGFVPPLPGDRQVIRYDGGRFPFGDKEFDYVICSHVVEHVEDVDRFIAEVIRVGRKGYLEFPTTYYDFLYNIPEHKTLLLWKDGVLRWSSKSDTRLADFKPVHEFFYETLRMGHYELVDALKAYFAQGFEWFGAIETRKVHSLESVTYRADDLHIPAPGAAAEGGTRVGAPPAPSPGAARAGPSRKPPGDALCAPPDLLTALGKPKAWLGFVADYRVFRRMSRAASPRFPLRWKDRRPCLFDRTPATGVDGHTVYHTAWAARILAGAKPEVHVDIASSLYFCSIVSAFIPMRHYDYRPVELCLDGLTTGSADLLALPFGNGELRSLSCMQALEHVGLGRHGEPIDPEGDLRAAAELKRVLAPGGSLLVAVPVGKPAIRFNAHRIYSYGQVVDCFSDLVLEEFALVPDSREARGLLRQATRETVDEQTYGCGCFWFRRKPA